MWWAFAALSKNTCHAGGLSTCRKVPTPVQPDQQLFLGRLCVPGRPVPPLLAALMPMRLIKSAIQASGEQQTQQQGCGLLSHGGSGGAAVAAAAPVVADGLLHSSPEQRAPAAQQAPPDASEQQARGLMTKRLPGLRDQLGLPAPKKPKALTSQQLGEPPASLSWWCDQEQVSRAVTQSSWSTSSFTQC